MKKICVYCGSSSGKSPAYMKGASELGTLLAEQDIALVYGGASVGTMGAVADAVLDAGGKVVGVIPQAISDMEVAHTGLSELEVVADMHQRKARMMELSDGFIAMPGGLGTLEEIFEALTWLQLGFHSKPCALFNINDYYSKLLEFLQHATEQGFVKSTHTDMLLLGDTANSVLEQLLNAKLKFESKL